MYIILDHQEHKAPHKAGGHLHKAAVASGCGCPPFAGQIVNGCVHTWQAWIESHCSNSSCQHGNLIWSWVINPFYEDVCNDYHLFPPLSKSKNMRSSDSATWFFRYCHYKDPLFPSDIEKLNIFPVAQFATSNISMVPIAMEKTQKPKRCTTKHSALVFIWHGTPA